LQARPRENCSYNDTFGTISTATTTVVWQKTNKDKESITRHDKPVAEEDFQDDKDDFIEFFLRPRGQQLDKDDCRVAEDE
jgi:hypothetical protein